MTDAILAEHLARRQRKAAGYAAEPERFKVCDQCWSVAVRYAGTCRICGAYRWDGSAARVIAVAGIIAQNPFPITAGTVPRLEAV